MSDFIYSVIASSISSAIFVSALIFLIKNWLIERLKASVGYEYGSQLEKLKAELTMRNNESLESVKHEVAKEFSAISMAHKTLEGSIAIAQQRKVESVEKLWSGIVALRNATPSAFTTADILLEHEFTSFDCSKIEDKKIFSTGEVLEIFTSKIDGDGVADLARLHVGEKLWFLFFAYRALYFRMAFEISESIRKNSFSPWYNSKVMKNILQKFFTPEEVAQMNSMKLSKFSYLRNVLEEKFLDEARRIVSGRDAGGDAMKYAMILREYANSVEEYKI